MIICVLLFANLLEQWEKENTSIFWGVTLLFAITFSSFDEVHFRTAETPAAIQKNVSQVLLINSGSGGSESKYGNSVLQTGLGKRKKFNIVFHRRLEQHFPDWKTRMAYQEKQEKFYKSAIKKRKEIKRLRLLDNKSYYTSQELDAMNYFHGTGFYQKQQDPEVKPNIFDTRQSFLRKMHDPIALDNFLDSFNRINN